MHQCLLLFLSAGKKLRLSQLVISKLATDLPSYYILYHECDVSESCIDWLKKQADEIGLQFNIVRFESPDLFALWLTWPGTNPSLKSVMLNSHIDVVPVDPVSVLFNLKFVTVVMTGLMFCFTEQVDT